MERAHWAKTREQQTFYFNNIVSAALLNYFCLGTFGHKVHYFFEKLANPCLYLIMFVLFSITISILRTEKAQMLCLGFEPTAAGWKAQTKPRSFKAHYYSVIQYSLVIPTVPRVNNPIAFDQMLLNRRPFILIVLIASTTCPLDAPPNTIGPTFI